jgi:arylsulfatase A-like enzyme
MPFNRRQFLQTTTAAAAASTLTTSIGDAAAPAKPPNVLFVLTDQWRASAMGIGSDEVVRTPNIDKLARQGTQFTRAYAANPVCTPNRSCILTGRHSHQHGMIGNDLCLPPVEICWPELFQTAGYKTHYVGKWHIDGVDKPGFVPPGWRRRGFGSFEGFNRGHIYHRHWGFDNEGGALEKKWKCEDRPYYEPTLQTDLAIDFMEHNKTNPFCCYLSWGPPHTPFNPPGNYDLYSPDQIKLRSNVPAEHRAAARKQLTGYYGLCESLDHELGRLTQYLDKSGLTQNTLVIFTSDHGELCGSHGKYRKGEPEDESLNVPLVMRMPGTINPSKVNSVLFNSVDLMPTMTSLCGLEDPTTCTGQNLVGAFTDSGKSPTVDSTYCQGKVNASQGSGGAAAKKKKKGQAVVNTWRTVVTQQYKLTLRGDRDKVEHIFDLKNDPFETENLATQPSTVKIRRELLTELYDWAKRTKDPFPKQPKSAAKMYSDEQAKAARG